MIRPVGRCFQTGKRGMYCKGTFGKDNSNAVQMINRNLRRREIE